MHKKIIVFITIAILVTGCAKREDTSSLSIPSESIASTESLSSEDDLSQQAPAFAAPSSEASLSSSSQSEVSQQQSAASAQEESTISSKTAELADYVKDEKYSLYSKIVSCSIENDIMTVIFSAYAENPINADVSMDVWMSSDNGAGQVDETYSIDKLKEYSISMSSSWFEQNYGERGFVYEVFITIATTRHSFYFHDGKIMS